MATVTGLTSARMEEIEDAIIVDANVVVDNLILTRNDAATIDAGNVRGATGATGPSTPVGCIYKYDITNLTLGTFRQVALSQPVGTPTVIATGLSIPTTIGRRYRYSLSGVIQFSAAPDIAHIRVLHNGVFHTSLYHGYSGLASSYHDVNRMGRSWVAAANPTTNVSIQMQRTTGAGSVTLDNTQSEIWFEVYDVGTLA